MNKTRFQEKVEELVREGALKGYPPEWLDGRYRWTIKHTFFEPDTLSNDELNEYIVTCVDTGNLALRHRAFVYDHGNHNWRIEFR